LLRSLPFHGDKREQLRSTILGLGEFEPCLVVDWDDQALAEMRRGKKWESSEDPKSILTATIVKSGGTATTDSSIAFPFLFLRDLDGCRAELLKRFPWAFGLSPEAEKRLGRGSGVGGGMARGSWVVVRWSFSVLDVQEARLFYL